MKSILIVIVHIIIVITWSTEQTNSPQAGCTISFSWNRGHGFWKASLVLAVRRHLVKHHGLPLLSTLEHHKLHVGREAPDPGIYLAGWEWRWTWAVDYCPDRTAIMEMIMERIFMLFIPMEWIAQIVITLKCHIDIQLPDPQLSSQRGHCRGRGLRGAAGDWKYRGSKTTDQLAAKFLNNGNFFLNLKFFKRTGGSVYSYHWQAFIVKQWLLNLTPRVSECPALRM